MNRLRRKGTLYSGVVHFVLLVFAIVGLPSILNPRPLEESAPITVDILPVSAMSNVKPHEAEPEPKKPEEKPKEAEQKKPSPPVKSAKDSVPPPADKLSDKKKPEEKKKDDKKKPDEKKDDKKKPKEDDLAAILAAVKETAQKERQDKEKASAEKASPAKSDHYDETMPLSLSEKDAIRNQIAKCWNVPAGAKDAQDLVVTLHIQLESTGTVLSVELAANQTRYATDTFFRAAADSAMRAVRQCSPLKDLDPEKYGTWKDMELTFNPKDMLL